MKYCFNHNCKQPENSNESIVCHSCGDNLLLNNCYSAIRLIGKGKISRTFLAIDKGELQLSLCVVKQLLNHNHSIEFNNKSSKLFTQPISKIEELGKHPQIPRLIAYFTHAQCFYLVYEFIEGKNLSELFKQKDCNEKDIWQLLSNVLPVISFFHNHQLIHGDIKPENIICRFHNEQIVWEELILVDVGTNNLVETNNLTAEDIIGSPEYLAPEQVKGKAVFASDLYSLGVTCIYLLTGISPFDLFDTSNNCWVWRQYLTEEVSERLAQVLNKLIQNDITKRFQSAEEVMQALGIQSKIQNPKSKIVLWECQQTLTRNSSISAAVNAVAISPNNQLIASGNDDKTVCLWNLTTGELVFTIPKHASSVNAVAFSPDSKMLATASSDRTIILWEVTADLELREIATLTGHTSAVKSVAFSPDGQFLASGSWDKTIKLWDVTTQQLIDNLTGHQLQVTSVAFSPDGQLLASGSFDRTVKLWRLKSLVLSQNSYLKMRPPLGGSSSISLDRTLVGHTWSVLSIAFSPDGKTLATASDDCTIQLWNLETGQKTCSLLSHSWSVFAVTFSPDGEILISGSADKTLKLWQVSTGQEICTLSGHSDAVCAVSISSTIQPVDTAMLGRLIVSGSKDKTIKMWQPTA